MVSYKNILHLKTDTFSFNNVQVDSFYIRFIYSYGIHFGYGMKSETRFTFSKWMDKWF